MSKESLSGTLALEADNTSPSESVGRMRKQLGAALTIGLMGLNSCGTASSTQVLPATSAGKPGTPEAGAEKAGGMPPFMSIDPKDIVNPEARSLFFMRMTCGVAEEIPNLIKAAQPLDAFYGSARDRLEDSHQYLNRVFSNIYSYCGDLPELEDRNADHMRNIGCRLLPRQEETGLDELWKCPKPVVSTLTGEVNRKYYYAIEPERKILESYVRLYDMSSRNLTLLPDVDANMDENAFLAASIILNRD